MNNVQLSNKKASPFDNPPATTKIEYTSSEYPNSTMIVYILRETGSDEPIAIFQDLKNAFRFSTKRCLEMCPHAYTTTKEFYKLDEELKTVVTVVLWSDPQRGVEHTVSQYTLQD